MTLLWGVHPVVIDESRSESSLEDEMIAEIVARGLARTGETVVITGGHPLTERGPTNFLKLRRL